MRYILTALLAMASTVIAVEVRVVSDGAGGWLVRTVGGKARAKSTWLSGYTKRVKLAIDSDLVDANLANLPVRVSLGDASGISSTDTSWVLDEVGTNYLKLAFTSSDGVTKLYGEAEQLTVTNGELWVSVPVVDSSTDSYIYLYATTNADDNSYMGVAGSAAASNVWPASVASVWHLGETGTGDRIDSAASGFDFATQNYDGEESQTCKINGGDVLTNSLDYLRDDQANAYSSETDGSLSLWFTATNDATLFASADNAAAANSYIIFSVIGGGIRIFQRSSNDSPDNLITTNTAFSDGLDHHVVISSDGTDYTVYVDNTEEAISINSGSNAGDWFADTAGRDNISCGGILYNAGTETGGDFGFVDEVRVYSTPLTAPEIKVNYYGDTDALITYSAQETQ